MLHTTLGFAHFEGVLIDVYRSEDVFAHHTFVEHDSIFIVVSLPRHISYKEVTTQCELTIFSSITFCKDISCLDTLSFVADRTKVNGHVLVSTAELRNIIFYGSRFEGYEFLVLCAVVGDNNLSCIYIIDNSITFCRNHCTAILADLLLDTSTYDWGF